jgi:hypothetical protein
MKKYIIFIVVLCLTFFSFGCDRKISNEKDILGVWAISELAKNIVFNFHPDSKIIFNCDHKFIAQNIPSEIFGNILKTKHLISGKGRWELDKSRLWLHFNSIDTDTNASIGTVLETKAGRSPVIFFFLGDPDEYRIVEFKKLNIKLNCPI